MADIEAFDVTAGWSEAERANLLGVQACLWTEHVHDRPALERLLFPRLAAFAESTWKVVGRHSTCRTRLPGHDGLALTCPLG